MQRLRLVSLAFSLIGLAGSIHAADWPQWRGPRRDDVSRETGLQKTWPPQGPALAFTFERAGVGHAGIAVANGRLYSMGGRGDDEYVYAVDLRTGKALWSQKIGSLFENNWGDGPRGTPTVDGDRVYALGAQGDLVCVDAETGKRLWAVSLPNDLGGRMMSGWGYTESPLVDGDRLVCSPGGSQGTLAALDKKSGKVLWRSKGLTDPAAYSSPVATEGGGIRQYVQMTPAGVVGVAAADGRLLWRSPIGANGTAVIPTPVVWGNYVYVTSGYGSGCGLLKLTPDKGGIRADKVYANKNMQNHHGGVVRVADYVYGYSDPRGWICQKALTGEIAWTERRKLGKGSLTCADGLLYCYSEDDGTLALVEASPDGWKEHGRFKIPRQTEEPRKAGKIWTHPVVADGRLFLRDQDLIFAFDVNANRPAHAATAASGSRILDFDVPGPGIRKSIQNLVVSKVGPLPWYLVAYAVAGAALLGLLVVLASRAVRRRGAAKV